jgi:hypothetical protein
MKRLLKTLTNLDLRKSYFLTLISALCLMGSAKAQNSANLEENKFSVSVNYANMEYSYKNASNSILTWRDLNMVGISLDWFKNNRGIYAHFAKSLGYGYSTDDDIANGLTVLTQHHTKSLHTTMGAYKKLADKNQSVGIGLDYKYFNNCKAGKGAFISANDEEKILGLAQNISQGFHTAPNKRGQKYHLSKLKMYYEYQKDLINKMNNSFGFAIRGIPSFFVGYGDWSKDKKFIDCGIELGCRVAIKYTGKKKFFIEIFNESSLGGYGLIVNNIHSKHSADMLKNTKDNILGISVGMNLYKKR